MEMNPFEVLGLSRELVKRLRNKPESLQKVCDAQYRVLQTLYHPDKSGGSEKQSALLNWAKEEFRKPQMVKEWVEHYIHGLKRNKLREKLNYALTVNDSLIKHILVPTFAELCSLSEATYIDLLELPEEGIAVSKTPDDLLDVRRIPRQHEREQQKRKSISLLRVEAGKLMRCDYGADPYPDGRVLLGVIRPQDVLAYSGGQSVSAPRARRLMQKKLAQTRDEPMPERTHRMGKFMTLDEFAGMMPLVRMEIVPHATLFSVSRQDTSLIFHQEGTILVR